MTDRNLAPPPRPFRVLIIEDTPDRQEVLKSLYKNQAWVLVHTGRRALTLLAAYDFDIVSLDYNLDGELTGADVAPALGPHVARGCRVVVHSQNPQGVAEIQRVLPDVIALPVAKMSSSNQRMKRLRAGIDAHGPGYDFAD
jgi:CheY-like chemotaxis protein